MDIEKLVTLAKQVAKPWAIVAYVLAALLGLSIGGNIYQATQTTNVIVEQENTSSHYTNNNITQK